MLDRRGPAKLERFARCSRLDTDQREEQVLADEAAVQQLIYEPAGSHVNGADREVKGVVNHRHRIQKIVACREPQMFVMPHRARGQPAREQRGERGWGLVPQQSSWREQRHDNGH